jgi:hypothetical protein
MTKTTITLKDLEALAMAIADTPQANGANYETSSEVSFGVDDIDEFCGCFSSGTPSGKCRTNGHYICEGCAERDPDTIRDPHSQWYIPPMKRRMHKGEW